MKWRFLSTSLMVLAIATFGVSCSKSKEASIADSKPSLIGTESASEIAASVVGGALSATEVGAMAKAAPQFFEGFGFWAPNVWAAVSQCSVFPLSEGVSSSGVVTFTFNQCKFPYSLATWNGALSFAFADSNGAVLSSPPADWVSVFSSNGYFQRYFSTQTTRVSVGGTTVSFNTTNPAGWDQASFVPTTLILDPIFNKYGTRVQVQNFTSATQFDEEVFIRGVQMKASRSGVDSSGSSFTQTVWDHTVSSDALNVSAVGGEKTLQMANGKYVYVQHNILRYTAKANFQNVKWDHHVTTGCGCYPVEGKILTELSGSRSGTETLVFTKRNAPAGFTSTGNCGTATFVSTSGAKTDLTMGHCF